MILNSIPILLAFLCACLFWILRRRGAKSDLPPGPKPLPSVGNIFDLPPSKTPEYQHWIKFNDKYGPVSSVTVLGTTLVILHSDDAIQELMVKNSMKTADRPKLYFADLCGFRVLTQGLPPGTKHRLHRKLLHQQMGTKALSAQFYDIQDVESRRFLFRVLKEPEGLIQHLKTEASAIILRMTYGYFIEPRKPDPLVDLIQSMMDNWSHAYVPLGWSVDILPFLKHLPAGFPGTSYRQTSDRWREETRKSIEVPYDFVLRQMENGTAKKSYVSGLVKTNNNLSDKERKSGREDEDEDAIKNTAATLYGAGADTTVSTISSFMIAMIMYPEVQSRAQAEIDAVVGADRLPTAKDREQLPYLNALIKEALRWLPVTPVGPTHIVQEDLSYAGYRIPKGAYLLPQIWCILHDPEIYPNPSAFDPERFLKPKQQPDPANHVFGYGLRICPGRYLADETLFLTISRVLATLQIGKALDENGDEIDVKLEATPGIIAHPKTFPYSIKPRSAGHAALIRTIEADHPWEESDVSNL